jgi:histidinol-phosphatase
MLEAELRFALDTADRAAAIAMSFFLGGFEVHEKPDLSPVTEADLAIEAMFREAVTERFPDDAVLGEEGGGRETKGRVWVIDPIDGTRNFVDGVPLWATLIALRIGGEGTLGVVSAPAIGERYEALRGGGARCNGRAIHVRGCDRIEDAFFLYSSLDEWLDRPHADAFTALVREARRSRGFGDFWGHTLVARGAADMMAEPELAVWDWAALEVIVREAGGRMTTFAGKTPSGTCSVLTTNGTLHDEVLRRLAITA